MMFSVFILLHTTTLPKSNTKIRLLFDICKFFCNLFAYVRFFLYLCKQIQIFRNVRNLLFFITAASCCISLSAADGALNGRFTIRNNGDQVVFSQGNLQFQPETENWQFAESQASVIGMANENILLSTYSGWIDLFGWGTGTNPTNASTDWQDYGTYKDWSANAIINGGNLPDKWRVMTAEEWNYLFFGRKNAATLFGLGCVNGQNGTIILPDDWTAPQGVTFNASTTQGLAKKNNYYANTDGKNFKHNIYTSDQWAVMEAAGAVFLPAAGYRWSDEVYMEDSDLGSMGYYWASSPVEDWKANCLYFDSYEFWPQNSNSRIHGCSVRLVQTPSETHTGIDYTGVSATFGKPQKFLRNGRLLILHNGRTYTAQGQMLH